MEIDQARLLTLYAAWKMDTEGKRAARQQISMIKVVAANVVMDVLDRAIQVHGSLGMSDDTPLAAMWRFCRMLRIADGPDEVHKMVIARRELNQAGKAPGNQPRRDSNSAAASASRPTTLPNSSTASSGLPYWPAVKRAYDALEDDRQLPVRRARCRSRSRRSRPERSA